jgi:hypothetical protein
MLTPKEKKTLARVEKNLDWSRWKFILVYGLLSGISLVVLTSAIDVFTGRVTVAQLMGKRLWINLIIIPVSGFLFAKIFHWQLVKKYLELKQKASNEQ